MNRGDIDVHTDVGDKVLMRSSLPGHATTFAEVRKVLPEWLPENASPPAPGSYIAPCARSPFMRNR